VRLSPISIIHAEALPYHLVYPPSLRDWPPLVSFRGWLFDELDSSLNHLRATMVDAAKESRAPASAPARKSAGPRSPPVQQQARRAGRR
jgi:LysR family glycine cleavage system transcriptional activator